MYTSSSRLKISWCSKMFWLHFFVFYCVTFIMTITTFWLKKRAILVKKCYCLFAIWLLVCSRSPCKSDILEILPTDLLFHLTNNLCFTNRSPSTILQSRPKVKSDFLFLLLLSRTMRFWTYSVTAPISSILMNTFVKLKTVELELHRWNLGPHFPSQTKAIFDVLIKVWE